MIRAPVLSINVALMVLLLPEAPALSQDGALPPVPISLRPAAEPIPALKYRLLPERHLLVPGNAAVFYHRALGMLDAAGQSERRQTEPTKLADTEEKAAGEWLTGPLESIPRDLARKRLEAYRTALIEARLGARRRAVAGNSTCAPKGSNYSFPRFRTCGRSSISSRCNTARDR